MLSKTSIYLVSIQATPKYFTEFVQKTFLKLACFTLLVLVNKYCRKVLESVFLSLIM